jgi:predicted transcriptional regulator
MLVVDGLEQGQIAEALGVTRWAVGQKINPELDKLAQRPEVRALKEKVYRRKRRCSY